MSGALLHLLDWPNEVKIPDLLSMNDYFKSHWKGRTRTIKEVDGKYVPFSLFERHALNLNDRSHNFRHGYYSTEISSAGREPMFHASFAVGDFCGTFVREYILYVGDLSEAELFELYSNCEKSDSLYGGYGYITAIDPGQNPVDFSQGVLETPINELANEIDKYARTKKTTWMQEINSRKIYLEGKIRNVFDINFLNTNHYNIWAYEIEENIELGELVKHCSGAYFWITRKVNIEKIQKDLDKRNLLIDPI